MRPKSSSYAQYTASFLATVIVVTSPGLPCYAALGRSESSNQPKIQNSLPSSVKSIEIPMVDGILPGGVNPVLADSLSPSKDLELPVENIESPSEFRHSPEPLSSADGSPPSPALSGWKDVSSAEGQEETVPRSLSGNGSRDNGSGNNGSVGGKHVSDESLAEQQSRRFDAVVSRDPLDPVLVKPTGTPIHSAPKPLLLSPSEHLSMPEDPYRHLQELKQVLGDGTQGYGLGVEPFLFHGPEKSNPILAYGAGLEGFYFRKIQLERDSGPLTHHIEDYFDYLDCLLAPIAWAQDLRSRLADLSHGNLKPAAKNMELNALLEEHIRKWQTEIDQLDASRWWRKSSVYMILSRAYNKLRPGKNFFDSLDEKEIDDIRRRTGSDTIWLMDIFEIGTENRWGTGGGSPYSILGYNAKPELGGDPGLKSFIERAHRKGMKVMVDFVPNHTSLYSDMMNEIPEGFLHMIPPQPKEGENIDEYRKIILAAAPPSFYLIHARNYPQGRKRVSKWILVHHPIVDYGPSTYIDMGQIDYSRPVAREWMKQELLRLFKDVGVDSVRMDMVYEDLNVRFFPRWGAILKREMEFLPEGWAKQEIRKMIQGFEERRAKLGGAEFLKQAMEEVRKEVPRAFFLGEAYTNFNDLSRIGIDAVYNKADFDTRMGQVGFYDAFRDQNPERIREALNYIAFRRWQRGAATTLQFPASHDDEGNPLDKFGQRYKALMALALLAYPNLIYNGIELAVHRTQMLLGDLSKSVDNNKAIPFDVPVSINWAASNPPLQEFLQKLWAYGESLRNASGNIVSSVLNPVQWKTPVMAQTISFTDSSTGNQKTFLMTANIGNENASGVFGFQTPVLDKFGAFVPRKDRKYLFKDYAHLKNGQPIVYERSGRELMNKGLYVKLDGGDVHLFEVEELEAGAPTTGPPRLLSISAWRERLASLWHAFRASPWHFSTHALVVISGIIFSVLQIPQIYANFENLFGGFPENLKNLPWAGYSTGILANMLLLGYFRAIGEKSMAFTQAAGVIMSSIVLTQLLWAGFMPFVGFLMIMPAIGLGFALNYLHAQGNLSDKRWTAWADGTSLLGLAVLPQALWSAFVPILAHFLPFLSPAMATSLIPLVLSVVAVAALYALKRQDKLPSRIRKWWDVAGAWTATFLFMYGPIIGFLYSWENPKGMVGISVVTMLMGIAGNLLLLPRMMIAKNVIGITGNAWAVLGSIPFMILMYSYGFLSPWILWPVMAAIPVFLLFAHLMNRRYPLPDGSEPSKS